MVGTAGQAEVGEMVGGEALGIHGPHWGPPLKAAGLGLYRCEVQEQVHCPS